ncbi:g1810 [Coccomyxa elongata]
MVLLSSLHEALAPAEQALHQVAVTQQRLALLQVQQLDATRDLLRLKEEQLKLRCQQLSALQALLSSFVCVHGGTSSTSQERARNQAILLLEQCKLDVKLAPQACASSLALDLEHAPRVSCLCAETDRRAQEVSELARHLLLLLTTANVGLASTVASLSIGAT